MYKESKEYIFSEIGKRIKRQMKELHFTYYQLAGYNNKADYESHQKDEKHDSKEDKISRYGKLDYSILVNIANGKAHPKKNPNLMSDYQILYLSKKLRLDKSKLIWGDFENSDFPKKLFIKLLLDTLYGEDKSLQTKLNDILIDYVPYAKYHSFWQFFVVAEIDTPRLPNSKYSLSSFFYNIREDEIFERYEPIQMNAIEFIFYKYDEQILKIIRDFLKLNFYVDDEYSLKKIDKKLTKLVSQLMNFFSENMPNEDSLGLRVRNIIISDYKKFGSLIAKKLSGEQFELKELNQKLLVESSLAYIADLERVQTIELEVIKGYKFNFK